jgi:hypothetical protein
VTGENIKLASARVDASGRAGGGKVLIGGDWGGGNPNKSLVSNPSAKLESFVIPTATTVSVDAATTINASARGHGNGGKVVLWSDSETTFAGTILARGGAKSGDGGFVETSSHGQLAFTGNVDTRAPRGKAGTLLLDPEDIHIVSSCDGPCQPSTITAAQIEAQLSNQNVVIATNLALSGNGDISVNASINWSNNNSLTLSAYRNIDISTSGVKIANFASGNLVLRADSTGTGQGTVVFDHGAHVDYTKSTGTVSIFYNPTGIQTTKYQNPTNYFCPPCPGGGGVFVNVNQPSQLTAYMLVDTVSDLDAVRTNTAGIYALGTKITFNPDQTLTPIPNFTGLFDGQGQTIANLTIASTTQNIGLFGTIASAGEVRNLNLTNVSVNSSVNSQLVGTLAGTNAGTISNVSATGIVQVGSGSTAGGLVGQNLGSISNSFASVDVGSPNAANLQAGGLVGNNAGTILSSAATGNVQTGDGSIAGGLVAFNSVSGAITGSQASSNVTVGAESVAGGFAGVSTGTITVSTASGAVTSTGANSTVGGLAEASAGTITDSTASGAVTSTGVSSIVGGLVGGRHHRGFYRVGSGHQHR